MEEISSQNIKPGMLVEFRHRQWVVLPNEDTDIILLKPIGGSDAEITGVYRPLFIPTDQIVRADFPAPTSEDLSDFRSARMLYDAAKLSFRNASGPFRCMGKLSFRPRSYQVVPLVMALKQDVTRLLIADDVGIGKTIEALMILKEFMERGEISRFAVICLPHLCEQWQSELKDKLDIDAVIFRSSNIALLERQVSGDISVFEHFPYQILSVDYIKLPDRMGRREMFIHNCPEFVIVDEIHTCAQPSGKGDQLRYELLRKISAVPERHLVFLTATPHSGKDEEFRSIIGLLNPEFAKIDIAQMSKYQRQQLAQHFVQRKRENLKRWRKNSNEHNPFPDRESKELNYTFSPAYIQVYEELKTFAQGKLQDNKLTDTKTRMRFWAALSLLRGLMSSPAAGVSMLENRKAKEIQIEDIDDNEDYFFREKLFDKGWADDVEIQLKEKTEKEKNSLDILIDKVKALSTADWKLQSAIHILTQWIKGEKIETEGQIQKLIFHPIIFCKYIHTAKYLGEQLKNYFRDKVQIMVVTSELADEERRERIQLIHPDKPHILVATDCLSEGINLQELFNAVLHYDLPWNPNRIEQRDGRVDRFGQKSPLIKTYTLVGENNPIDSAIFKVLYKKIYEIRNSIGVSISLGEEGQSVMENIITEVFQNSEENGQLNLWADQFYTEEIEKLKTKAEGLRSIFAHENVKAEEIEKELKEVDEAIGDVKTVENFVVQAIHFLGGLCRPVQKEDFVCFTVDLTNLPGHLSQLLPKKGCNLTITFESPTPAGMVYIGRNHRFVEQLCQYIMYLAFEKNTGNNSLKVARSAVIQTDSVGSQTTLIQFRVRNVIREIGSLRETIAEEVFLWGYNAGQILPYEECKQLLLTAQSAANLAQEIQIADFKREENRFKEKSAAFQQVAVERAEHLVEAHGRFRTLVGGKRYEKVEPVLPPDILGVYILKPIAQKLF